jgi:hypothetical protein
MCQKTAAEKYKYNAWYFVFKEKPIPQLIEE